MSKNGITCCSNDGFFSPASWPHEVISPGLAALAAKCNLDRDSFVRQVIAAVPEWARSVLGKVSADQLCDSSQEFCSQMIQDRPDLRYVPCYAGKKWYLETILRYIHYRLIRQQSKLQTGAEVGEIMGDQNEQLPPDAAAQRELFDRLTIWVEILPDAERQAVLEQLTGRQCQCESKDVHYVRFFRGVFRMRQWASNTGVIEKPSVGRRRRFPRTYRSRPPRIRIVRRTGVRTGCANARNVLHVKEQPAGESDL